MSKEVLFESGGVRGWLHEPASAPSRALVMTHGAGGNAKGEMLIAIARALASQGWLVLRCDLPFRQQRAAGPPRPTDAPKDRQGLRDAVDAMRTRLLPASAGIPVTLGGHSYGGRQASMLAAEAGPDLAIDSLLLCSYPLHPPARPDQLRTAHFSAIGVPVLFVHGTRDPFGTPDEMRAAIKLVPGKAWIEFIEGAGHDLKRGKELGFLKLL